MRLFACVVLVGCATTAPSDPYDVDLSSGAADGAGIELHEVEVGDRLELSVEAGDMVALRIHGDGAVVARRTSGDLDPYIIVKNASKQTLSQSLDQVIAPSLDPRDSIVIARSDSFVLISGEDLESGGDFTVDVIAIPHARPMMLEATPCRITGATLRQLEPARASAVANGYLVENADGTIEQDLSKIPLSERATVARLTAELTETRDVLADFLAPASRSDALANLAAIWAAI